MKLDQLLIQYLEYAPEEVKKSCSIFCQSQEFDNYTPGEQFTYKGFIFKENRIFAYNILIWNRNNWEFPKYLDVTEIIKKITNHYNIYHAIQILNACLQKYYRENVLTENNILIFKYYDKRYKHKFRYNTKKHRGRERMFIESNRHRNNSKWNTILYQSAIRDVFIKNFGQYKRERPDSVLFDYSQRAIDLIIQNKSNTSDGI